MQLSPWENAFSGLYACSTVDVVKDCFKEYVMQLLIFKGVVLAKNVKFNLDWSC